MPHTARFRNAYSTYARRRRAASCLFVAAFAVLFTLAFILVKPLSRLLFSARRATLVFQRQDLQRIWTWEIESGHYPSSRELPHQLQLASPPHNPARPPSRVHLPPDSIFTDAVGVGPTREYLHLESRPPNVAYPPRPSPGSVADLDAVMDYCDFSKHKYVRDCLEVLRVGAGLDPGNHVRRANIEHWHYIYREEHGETAYPPSTPPTPSPGAPSTGSSWRSPDPNHGLTKKRGADWEPHLHLPPPRPHRPSAALPGPCDDENPRLFHMFWVGPFTDKPYTAILSFLYTQNTRLHLYENPHASGVCRPQLWMWINVGPLTPLPAPTALRDMYDELQANPWAAPFLHPRFADLVHFKPWNTTEQLDAVPEIRAEWRAFEDRLFNSGGHIIDVPAYANGTRSSAPRADSADAAAQAKASTVLSDMARFVLCHRFGGVYLDTDNILLRDWEELWGWKGAFAYRWSRLPDYNTAVLRMSRGSALGSWLFRTALRNGMDFHPMTVTRYTRDAHLQGLLLRLPDALFDPAWLNTENWQRDRPPQPYFTSFDHFFNTPERDAATPAALGFDGFFKGAYSYHYHNSWHKPFDPARNWPELGPRFGTGERKARAALGVPYAEDGGADGVPDRRDLDWATVVKRRFEAYVRGERPNMYGEWLVW